MKKFNISLFMIVGLFTSMAYAQSYQFSGQVLNEDGSPVFGATIYIEEFNTGDYTSTDGRFVIEVPSESITFRISAVGYETLTSTVSLPLDTEFVLNSIYTELPQLEVSAQRADLTTPAAFTSISKTDIENEGAGRSLPEILSATPSVYGENQGGSGLNARLNIRGWSDGNGSSNISLMVNGVPATDLENGRNYWSNWAGLVDGAGSIQIQRGLSNVNLASPEPGGAINILSEPAKTQAGGTVTLMGGSGQYENVIVNLNSGLINNKIAFSFTGNRLTSDGIANGTWADSWSYNAAFTYILNDKNSFGLYAVGATQRHSQRQWAQNIGSFSHDFARTLDSYDVGAFEDYYEQGFNFNQNVAPVYTEYNGQQFVGEQVLGPEVQKRRDANELAAEENFYHKPVVNFNWYSQPTNEISFSNVLYYIGGSGGGLGDYGEILRFDADRTSSAEQPFFFGPGPWTWDWNGTIDQNLNGGEWVNDFDSGTNAPGQSIGILRNSRNNQWTWGNNFTLDASLNENLTLRTGFDVRRSKVHHYREVRDLLGGSYFIDPGTEQGEGDMFNPGKVVGLGDKIKYNFHNTINWVASFAQLEYQGTYGNLFATFGYTSIKYGHKNYFIKDSNGGRLTSESDRVGGYQIKAGGLREINENLSFYISGGYVSKAPRFDGVIDDDEESSTVGVVTNNPENEKYTFAEAGLRLFDDAGRFATNINFYYTLREDRRFNTDYETQTGQVERYSVTGVNQRHLGLEVESAFQASEKIRIDFTGSFANWEFVDDVSSRFIASGVETETNLYIKGLKVGNAPQTQLSYALTWRPVNEFSAKLRGYTAANHYSQWSPTSRTDASDRAQVWKMPNVTHWNLNLRYNVNSIFNGAELFFNVINLTDETYIQYAVDNSRFNAYDDDHDADDAEVFFALPRRINFGFKLNF